MRLGSSVWAYLRIRPQDFRDALRLLAAYAVSVLLRVAVPSRFQSVGRLVRGRRNLRVSIDGIRFEVRPRTNDLDLVCPKHEPETARWLRGGPGDVVVDVGAHIGRYTLMVAPKAAKVIAIEPDPENFRLLGRNVTLNHLSNVVLVPRAMTSRPGVLLLSPAIPENTGTSSVKAHVDEAAPDHPTGRDIHVLGETLDHIVEASGLDRIDWLKIDVEGHEIALLEGADSALGITHKLILEVTGSTSEACRRFLEARGFRLVAIEVGDPASNLLLERRSP